MDRAPHDRVGGYAISFGKDEDVTAHHLPSRDPAMAPFSDDERPRAGQVARVAWRSHHQIEAACRDEHYEHWLSDYLEGDGEESALLLRGQFVGTVQFNSAAGLVFAEAGEPP